MVIEVSQCQVVYMGRWSAHKPTGRSNVLQLSYNMQADAAKSI